MEEYIERRPVSFLDLLAANTGPPESHLWTRLAYQVTLIVTQKCNMRCTYCYDKSRIEKETDKTELSADEFVAIINKARAVGVGQIKLTGGEVFYKKGIDKILEACQGTALYLCTNGTLLHEWIDFLAGLEFRQLHIHTSLDGLDSHLKYAKNGIPAAEMLALFRRIRQSIPNVHISVNTVLNKDNLHEIIYMHPLIAAAGFHKWTVSTPYLVSEIVRSHHPFPDFRELAAASAELVKLHIEQGEPFQLSIGGLYKYEMFDKKTIPPKQAEDHPCLPNCNGCRGMIIDSFGNILDCLLDNAPEKGTMRSLKPQSFIDQVKTVIERDFYKMKIKDAEACTNCRYVALCGGGCRYNSFVFFGNYSSPDPIRCSYYPLMEKHILPALPHSRAEILKDYLRDDGIEPLYLFDNIEDIRNFLAGNNPSEV